MASDEADGERDAAAERHRAAVQEALDAYGDNRYPAGVLAVYGASSGGKITIVACIEASDGGRFARRGRGAARRSAPRTRAGPQVQPQQLLEWALAVRVTLVVPSGGGEATIKGVMKAAVHYYEDGNAALSSSKDAGDGDRAQRGGPGQGAAEGHRDEENGYQVRCCRGCAPRRVRGVDRRTACPGTGQEAINGNYNDMSEKTFKALHGGSCRDPLEVGLAEAADVQARGRDEPEELGRARPAPRGDASMWLASHAWAWHRTATSPVVTARAPWTRAP